MTASNELAAVSLCEVTKSFGTARALDRVTLELQSGEVHVLAGENGAGKSTLIRILSGAYSDYQGEMRVAGRAVRFAGPQEAQAAGIATIHQELSLVGAKSVADNLLLGEIGSMWGLLDQRRRHRRARKVLAEMDLDIDPAQKLESLPLATRQLVEIARALAQRARVIIMDEPTSALSEVEAQRLFGRIGALRESGRTVLYISHRMEEIYQLADRISVLRDGLLVASAAASELPRQQLVEKIIGRSDFDGGAEAGRLEQVDDRQGAALEVRDLAVAAIEGVALLKGVSLSLAPGEVLGVAGLQGSGVGVLPYAIFGAIDGTTGTVALHGEELVDRDPGSCVDRKMLLLSRDRGLSLVQASSVAHNAALSSLPRFSRGGWVRRRAERRAVEVMAKRLTVDCPSLDAPVWQLSGGNQQKVALARCLLTEPSVLLLEEPTRGIDIGARAEVYALIRRLAERGVGILMVASETDELMRLSHRIMVLAQGRLAAMLPREEFSRARILAAAMGEAA